MTSFAFIQVTTSLPNFKSSVTQVVKNIFTKAKQPISQEIFQKYHRLRHYSVFQLCGMCIYLKCCFIKLSIEVLHQLNFFLQCCLRNELVVLDCPLSMLLTYEF